MLAPADIDEPMEPQVDTEMSSVVANDAPDAPHPVPAVDEAQPDAPLPDEHAVDTSPVDAPGEGDGDVKMEDSVPPESTPAPTPGPANEHIATSDDDHAKPPPAKPLPAKQTSAKSNTSQSPSLFFYCANCGKKCVSISDIFCSYCGERYANT